MGGIVSTEQIIEDIALGKKVIMVDSNDRENEGDVVIAAEKATPSEINFMITHCRGVLCLCIDKESQHRLGLNFMERRNIRDVDSTAHFTVSIEACKGITTGVSTHDRYVTIRTAIDPQTTAKDIRTPGHVFPLVASTGGLLERKGHTEASITLASLAGLKSAAVITEVLRDDGHMARIDYLIPFAEMHGINIGFVDDLVEYLRKHTPRLG